MREEYFKNVAHIMAFAFEESGRQFIGYSNTAAIIRLGEQKGAAASTCSAVMCTGRCSKTAPMARRCKVGSTPATCRRSYTAPEVIVSMGFFFSLPGGWIICRTAGDAASCRSMAAGWAA